MFLPTHQPKHLTYGKTFDLAAITVVPWAGAVSSLCDRHVLSFDPSKAFDLAAGFTLGSRLYPGLALSPLSEIAAPLRPRFDLRLFGDKLSHFVFRRPHSPRDGATWRGRGAIPTVTPGCTFQGTSLYFRRWARSNSSSCSATCSRPSASSSTCILNKIPAVCFCMLIIVVWNSHRGKTPRLAPLANGRRGFAPSGRGIRTEPRFPASGQPAPLHHPINFPHRPRGCQDWKELSSTISRYFSSGTQHYKPAAISTLGARRVSSGKCRLRSVPCDPTKDR